MAKSSRCLLLVCSSCVLLVLLHSDSTLATSGKRFDCRLFCKMTGYHGMIGGCRCSFTLFAAKRNDPLWAGKPMDPQETTKAEYPPSTHQLVNGRNFKVGDDYAEDLDEMRPVRRPAGSPDARYNWDLNKKFLRK